MYLRTYVIHTRRFSSRCSPTVTRILHNCHATFIRGGKSKGEMLSMERIPDQIGYLVLKEDGAVLTSGGELENDERIANIVMNLLTLTDTIDPKAFASKESFNKISITYADHCYVICLSNKKIHIVKKKIAALTSSQEQQHAQQTVIA